MGTLDESNSFIKKVDGYQHLVLNGLNAMIINLAMCKRVKDNRGQIGFLYETEKHYCSELSVKGLNQPVNSFVIVKKKLLMRFREIVIKDFDGLEPTRLPIIIKRFKSGNNYCYQVLYTLDEKALDDVIELILSNRNKPVYALFVKGNELNGWRY